jgi:hypothetical protein
MQRVKEEGEEEKKFPFRNQDLETINTTLIVYRNDLTTRMLSKCLEIQRPVNNSHSYFVSIF